MPNCTSCASWICARVTVYGNGSTVARYQAPDGKGECQKLGIETAAMFGCNEHSPAPDGFEHAEVARKDGAPWQHWTMIPCPDCGGAGSTNDRPDDRCAGTGKVRLYDDGHVGDERTRKHPKEGAASARPTCAHCGAPVEESWLACPACGKPKHRPAETEEVHGLGGGV